MQVLFKVSRKFLDPRCSRIQRGGSGLLTLLVVMWLGVTGVRAEPASSSPDSVPAIRPAGDAEVPVLTLKGVVRMPDGSVAKDAVIEHASRAGTSDIERVSIVDGQFEIRTRGLQLNQPSVLFRNADGSLQAILSLGGHTLRRDCAAAKEIKLAATKTVHVKVTDQQQLVAGAFVELRAGGYSYSGKTERNGICDIRIPEKESIFFASAWTDDHKIAGREPKRDRFGPDFHMEVTHDAPIRVRVLDDQQRPVAKLPFQLGITGGENGELFAPDNATSLRTTDANGEAVFEWIPDWPKQSAYVELGKNSGWRIAPEGDLKTLPDGTRQLTVAPSRAAERVAVTGKLSGVATDLTGILVELWSFQGEEEGTSDVLYARSDAEGRFTTKVLPGSAYCVFVNDTELVAPIWDGMLVDEKGALAKTPELTLSTGVPVEVLVTKGANNEPMRNAGVELETPHRYSFRNPDGTKGDGESGRRFSTRTDDRGQFTAPVIAGTLKIRATDGDWESKQTIQVAEGQPAKIHIHRKVVDKQTITGKLVLPKGVTADLSGTTIKIAGMDGESEDAATVTCDAEGHFTAAIAAGRFSILAMSKNEEFFGCGIENLTSEVIEVPVHPTVSYEGHVLGPNSVPQADVKISMMARLIDHQREYPAGTPSFEKQYVELFRGREVTTDATGHFVIPKTPQRMVLSIDFTFTLPGEMERSFMQQKYLSPGEDRPANLVRIRPRATSAPEKKPLSVRLADTLKDCELAGIHSLVIVPGPGDLVEPFVGTHFTNPEQPMDSYSYRLAEIDAAEAAKLPDRLEYFKAHRWPFPEADQVFVTALDGAGQELGRLTLDLKDEAAAAKEAAAFLKKHLPPQHDAKVGFDAALAEAKRTGRRLWVRVGQTRCGPCFRFTRWLDAQKELLAKDYVIFKFDDVRDLHGHELSVTLKFDVHGVPCHAILDGDGKELINSIGPLGNIGSPVGDFEGTEHLHQMLKKTAQNLTEKEIDQLILTLVDE